MALFCCGGHFTGMVWVSEGSLQISKVVLSDHLYPMMKHFYPDGSGPFQNDNAPIHGHEGSLNVFNEYENDVNHTLRPS